MAGQRHVQLLQQGDEVVILYEQDQQVRHVRLNAQHPGRVTPTWWGNSVGHYEGDTLVVDTVGIKVGPVSMVDIYGTPFTDALHVVERYRLIDYEAAKAATDKAIAESGYRGANAINEGVLFDPEYLEKGWKSSSRSRTRAASLRPGPRRLPTVDPRAYGPNTHAPTTPANITPTGTRQFPQRTSRIFEGGTDDRTR